jgi:hypothetical protein
VKGLDLVERPPIIFTERPRPGIQFTETMRGRVVWQDEPPRVKGPEDDVAPWEQAAVSNAAAPMQLTLTVISDDIEGLVSSREHVARLIGTVSVEGPGFPARSLPISQGRFHLFVIDADRVETRYIAYRMTVAVDPDVEWRIDAKKVVRRGSWRGLWRALTTLYITIVEEGPGVPRRRALGVLTVDAHDLASQLATLRPRHAQGLAERVDVYARLIGFFLAVSRATGGGMLARSALSTPDAAPRARRIPPGEFSEHEIPTSDRTRIHLTRYRGGPLGPVILSPGFSVRAASFAADTVGENLVQYLVARSYDVWLFDYRASSGFAAAGSAFSIDDIALRDYPAAVSTVLGVTHAPNVQIVAHCVGSLSLLMSLLAGKLENQVRSIICSQLGLHPIPPEGIAELKFALYIASVLRWLGMRTTTAHFDPHSLGHRIADKLLALYPTAERCNNPACRRILLLFGESFRHDKLNTATHEAIDDWFGTTSMPALTHLSLMLRARHVVDKDGRDVYLPRLDRLCLPISFIHGTRNREFVPRSTATTYKLLRSVNGPRWYVRRLVKGYGHMDCFIGKDAARDVFPIIERELVEGPKRS